MKEFLELSAKVIKTGVTKENRTGTDSIGTTGELMKFDMRDGFPAVTTKFLAFKTAMGEMCGFIRGFTSAAQFRSLGCKVWDQNANENEDWLANPNRKGHDHLGRVYGAQWRSWKAYKEIAASDTALLASAAKNGFTELSRYHDGDVEMVVLRKVVDQLRECLDTIMHNPDSRRILFHGWNPAELDEMALPPCHLLYMFHPEKSSKTMGITVFIRSNDLGLGNPLNVAEAAALLSFVCHLTGYEPSVVSLQIADAHVYVNHLEMIQTQLSRTPLQRPQLRISERIPKYAETGIYQPEWLDLVEPGDFTLEGYQHCGKLSAPMAV